MNPFTTLTNTPAIQARAGIPPQKRKSQWVRTGFGIAVAVGGLITPKYLGYPWQVGAVIAGLGGFIASQQLVTDYLKAVPQFIGAVVKALGGKSD